jgi:CRISPR system Cascade subunit CasA
VSALKSNFTRGVDGISDLYTWRTRSIRLKNTDHGGIEQVAFASGVGRCDSNLTDPQVAYRKDDKHGILSVQFTEKGLWRDFDCFLPDDSKLAPAVITHAIRLARSDGNRFPQSIMVLGQSNSKAKVEFWRMERFALPKALIGEKSIRSFIRSLLKISEEKQKILWGACNVYARHLLSHGDREPAGADVKACINQMVCIPLYWSILEAKFHVVLGSFSLERDWGEIEEQWQADVKKAISEAWAKHESSISMGNVWALRALVQADMYLHINLRKKINLKEGK